MFIKCCRSDALKRESREGTYIYLDGAVEAALVVSFFCVHDTGLYDIEWRSDDGRHQTCNRACPVVKKVHKKSPNLVTYVVNSTDPL